MEVTTEAITEAAREAATGRPPSPQTVWPVTRAGVVQNTRREPKKHGVVCPRSAPFFTGGACASQQLWLFVAPPCLFQQQPPNLPVERASSSDAALYGAAELATHGAAVDEQPPLPD